MWPFKSKNKRSETKPGPLCTNCNSLNTMVLPVRTNVRTWRGQRYSVARCSDCGQDFYVEVQPDILSDKPTVPNDIIDDEESLHAAEEEIQQQANEGRDRTCR